MENLKENGIEQIDTVVDNNTETTSDAQQGTDTNAPDSVDGDTGVADPNVVEDDVKQPRVSGRLTKADLAIEIGDLKEDIALLQANLSEKDTTIATLQAELAEYKNTNKSHVETVEKYNGILQGIIDEKKAQVPEEITMLLPDGLTLEKQLEWFTKAIETGKALTKDTKPVVEIGKPMNMGKPNADVDSMTPHQKLSSYFSTVFSK